jgi:hypothetical protein
VSDVFALTSEESVHTAMNDEHYKGEFYENIGGAAMNAFKT